MNAHMKNTFLDWTSFQLYTIESLENLDAREASSTLLIWTTIWVHVLEFDPDMRCGFNKPRAAAWVEFEHHGLPKRIPLQL